MRKKIYRKSMYKKYVKLLKSTWKHNPINIIIPIISILALIIGTFVIGFRFTFVLVVLLNCIAFLPAIIKKKEKKMKNTNNTNNNSIIKKRKTIKKIIMILIIMIIIALLCISSFFIYIVMTASKFDPGKLYSSVPSILYDKDGNEAAKLGSQNRVLLEYNEIPEVLIDAIVATEDSRFFQHNGVDWARFSKASVNQLLGNSNAGGASTLTMQLSKNTYTSTEASGIKGIIRKFKDIYISISQIEKNYSKQEIMEFYVNSNYLGYNSYGVEQASLTYFNKSAKDLNLAEAAMIAGLFQAPGKYDAYNNIKQTEKRRKTVLYLMLRHGYITKDEYNIAKKMSVDKIVVPLNESSYSENGISKYQSFVDEVVDEVKKQTGLNPYTTSMKIYTTMDSELQNYITNIMNGNDYKWENDIVQAGVAVTDVKTGAIAALGGGRNIKELGTLNRATQIKRQIGSTAKPLYDYGPAIEYMNWSPATPIVDEPSSYSDGKEINNWDGRYQGFINVRTALIGSRNIPALKTFKANSKSNILTFVNNLGLHPESSNNSLHEAHSIGGYTGENPLSMAAAYAAFSNGGYYIKPYAYTKIIINETDKEYVTKLQKTKAMSEETAYIVSNMLVDTAKYALGRYSNINGATYGAKTGTTNFDDETMTRLGLTHTSAVNDLWVVGFDTKYSMGVWYGYDKNNKDYYNKLSSSQNSRLFQAVGKKAFTAKDTFKRPAGVVDVEIELQCSTLCLPSEYTPSSLRKTELFVSGAEPTNISERFAQLTDITNLKSQNTDKTIELSWSAATQPKVNSESYLKESYSTLFQNTGFLNSFISSRLSYNENVLGAFGYNVYEKDSIGLTLLGFTTNTKYTITPSTSGNHEYIIKTSYANFKNNMSKGKNISVNFQIENEDIINPIENQEDN